MSDNTHVPDKLEGYMLQVRHECLIKAEHLHITVIKEPAAKTQSR